MATGSKRCAANCSWNALVGFRENMVFGAKLKVCFPMLGGACGAPCCPFLKNSAILPNGVFCLVTHDNWSER